MITSLINILLVEDSNIDLLLFQKMLQKTTNLEFKLNHRSTLTQGINYTKNKVCDIIFLDLFLPDSNGLDTLVTMRKSNSTLPIVVLTGLDDDEIALKSLRMGAQDYLIKRQVNPDLLFRSMRYAIERQKIEAKLQKLTAELETRVEARTEELIVINQKLQKEIEDRILAENALQKLNKELEKRIKERLNELSDIRYALDQSAMIAITDANGIITYVNDRFCDISKYKREEIIGKTHKQINSGYHSDDFFHELWLTISRGEVWRGTIKNKAKDGSYYWVNTTIVPFLDQKGKPWQYLAVRTDITPQKQAEEFINKNNQILQAITNAQSRFIAETNINIIFDGLLEELLELSDSDFSFVGEIDSNPEKKYYLDQGYIKIKGYPHLQTYGIPDLVYNQSFEISQIETTKIQTLEEIFALVLHTGKPIISNNLSLDHYLLGIQGISEEEKAFLGLPLYKENKLIGIVGLANNSGYDEEMIEYLEPFISTCANIIHAYRNEQRRKEAEKQLKTSLREKEVLLKEIHHRVKNNLLVVSSLLEFQNEYSQDETTAKFIQDTQQRIYSMALIHDQLYQSDNLEKINLAKYLKGIVEHLMSIFAINYKNISLHFHADTIGLNVETAIPCGLIINELVSNIFEHAFTTLEQGDIWINITQTQEKNIIIKVKDNGVGFPDHLDFRQTDSLGLQLVCLLTEQLGGTIELIKLKGSIFKLTFKELLYKKRI